MKAKLINTNKIVQIDDKPFQMNGDNFYFDSNLEGVIYNECELSL